MSLLPFSPRRTPNVETPLAPHVDYGHGVNYEVPAYAAWNLGAVNPVLQHSLGSPFHDPPMSTKDRKEAHARVKVSKASRSRPTPPQKTKVATTPKKKVSTKGSGGGGLTAALHDELILEASEWAYKKAYSEDYKYENKEGKVFQAPRDYNGIVIDETLANRWRKGVRPACASTRSNSSWIQVVRPNHAIDDAVRKVMLMPYIAFAYDRHHKHNTSIFQKGLQREYMFMMQLGALFESSGRHSEIGFGDHKAIYGMFKKRAFGFLKEYINQDPRVKKIARTLVDPERCGSTTVFDRVFDALAHMYTNKLEDKTNFHFKTLFEMAHDIELVRCFGSDVSKLKMQEKLDEMNTYLGGLSVPLMDLAIRMLDESGATIQYVPEGLPQSTRMTYDCDVFGQVANSAEKCIEIGRKVLPSMDQFREQSTRFTPDAKEKGDRHPKWFAPCERALKEQTSKSSRSKKSARKAAGTAQKKPAQAKSKKGSKSKR